MNPSCHALAACGLHVPSGPPAVLVTAGLMWAVLVVARWLR